MRLACVALLFAAGIGLNAATPKLEPSKSEGPPVLRKSPEFVIKFNDGHQMLLSSLKGKVVALLMVHTTCPHCQRTSQAFTDLYKEYGPRGFQPVDAAFNTMANLYVPDFVKNFGIGYPVGFSTPEEVMAYLGYNIMQRYTVPQIVWIDRKGNIRSQTTAAGDETELYTEGYWRNMIETLLKEPATTHHTSVRRHAVAQK
ncbi:MAG TPA: TlpA disulfide reductase family protein [Bryobacteraceae bacterium]|nr:TlpA disulfide reductase family protein [Bryobacteraceae bacterium]